MNGCTSSGARWAAWWRVTTCSDWVATPACTRWSRSAARIDHPDLFARNIELHGVGHMSLLIDRRVVRAIASLLAHRDEDGSPRPAAVTSIDPAAASAESAGRPASAGVPTTSTPRPDRRVPRGA